MVVHAKPSDRASWGFHGKEGWTIGPALEHYRCIQCYMPLTRSTINCDTLAFFPHNIPFPKVSTDDYLKQATQDIIQLLTHPIAQLPYLQVGDVTKNAILQIAQMLNRSIDQVVDLNNTTPYKTKLLPTNVPNHIEKLPRVQRTPLQ